jgi:hypothetical protein
MKKLSDEVLWWYLINIRIGATWFLKHINDDNIKILIVPSRLQKYQLFSRVVCRTGNFKIETTGIIWKRTVQIKKFSIAYSRIFHRPPVGISSAFLSSILTASQRFSFQNWSNIGARYDRNQDLIDIAFKWRFRAYSSK